VVEQGAATQEISRNVQQAAQGTQQVSSNVTDVQRGASETGSASSQVLSAAQMLSGDSNRLKIEVSKFLGTAGRPDRKKGLVDGVAFDFEHRRLIDKPLTSSRASGPLVSSAARLVVRQDLGLIIQMLTAADR
jgi:hypothetical protein